MSEDTSMSVDDIIQTESSKVKIQHAYNKKIQSDEEWIIQKEDLKKKMAMSRLLFPKRGEIWTCTFGYNLGSEINDVRPCVIIQNDIGNQNSPTVIVVPITHKVSKMPTQVFLTPELVDYSDEGIDGNIHCEQIRTCDKVRLGRRIGRLSEKGIEELNKAMSIAICIYGFSTIEEEEEILEA